MKRLILSLLGLTLLVGFVGATAADPWWVGPCWCPNPVCREAGLYHDQGHPLCRMPYEYPGVPPGPPYAPDPPQQVAGCLEWCLANPP